MNISRKNTRKNQIGAFDSRQVMLRADYEIAHKLDTLLNDVELHHHDFYEIVFLLSGDVDYSVESHRYHMRPGDLLLIGPQELHQVSIRSGGAPYERYVLWVSRQMLHRLSTAQTDLCSCFLQTRQGRFNLLHLQRTDIDAIHSMMDVICREQTLRETEYGADRMADAMMTGILVLLNRAAMDRFEETEQDCNTLVSGIVDYLNLHYSEPLSLDQLAEQFFVSKYHLSHAFSQQVGTSVYRYLQKKRLQIARQLLAQGLRSSQVFLTCGFRDYAGFYRAFKAEYGISPRDYAVTVRNAAEAEP